MIKLILNNSVCQIQGLAKPLFDKLSEILSYKGDPKVNAFRTTGFVRATKLLSPRGEFPTGLLYVVKAFLTKNKQLFEEGNKRIKPEPKNTLLPPIKLSFTPYPEQEEAANAAVASEDGQGIIVAPTALGKSTIIGLMIDRLKVKTLIVVPTLSLKHQLTESMGAMFSPDSVGGIKENKPIAVENVDALTDLKKLESYFSNYDAVVIDEFHHSGAKTYRMLHKKAWKNIYYRFGLTATPFRSQDHERILLESVLSKVIYKISYKTALEKGYIAPVTFYAYKLPKTEVKGYTWREVYEELVTSNKYRNELIAEVVRTLSHVDHSTLILVREIEHGNNINSSLNVPFAQGVDDLTPQYINDFNARRNKTLLGTTGVIGEGVDTKPTSAVIIAGLGKSKNAFMQMVGRGFRKHKAKVSCTVILFYDPSHKWTRAHFREQVKIIKEEYGQDVIMIPA